VPDASLWSTQAQGERIDYKPASEDLPWPSLVGCPEHPLGGRGRVRSLRRLTLVQVRSSARPRLDEHGNRPGPIRDLRLPPKAWYVLQRESITSMSKPRAVANRLERFEGIGSKLGQAIRTELTRVKPPANNSKSAPETAEFL
jgi:hypothetical protein